MHCTRVICVARSSILAPLIITFVLYLWVLLTAVRRTAGLGVPSRSASQGLPSQTLVNHNGLATYRGRRQVQTSPAICQSLYVIWLWTGLSAIFECGVSVITVWLKGMLCNFKFKSWLTSLESGTFAFLSQVPRVFLTMCRNHNESRKIASVFGPIMVL